MWLGESDFVTSCQVLSRQIFPTLKECFVPQWFSFRNTFLFFFMLVLCHSTSEGQAKACEWFCARSDCGALKEINEYGYTRCIPKEEEGQNHTTNQSRDSDPLYALFVDLFFDCGSEKYSLERSWLRIRPGSRASTT